MSDKKTELEKIATNSVQKHGFKDLSFRTLANEAGIKSASVHYYFPGKADLANSLIENYRNAFYEELLRINTQSANLKEKLNRLIDIFEDVLRNGKLCLCGMFAAEVETLNDQGRELLEDYFKLSEAWITEVIEAGKADLVSSLSPESLSKIILSGLEGAILLDRVKGGATRLQAQRDLINSFVA